MIGIWLLRNILKKNLNIKAFTSHFYQVCLKLFQRKQDFDQEISTQRQLDISQVTLDNHTDNEESDDADNDTFFP